MKTSFMTSNLKQGQCGVGLFGNLKVERGLSLFPGEFKKAFSTWYPGNKLVNNNKGGGTILPPSPGIWNNANIWSKTDLHCLKSLIILAI